MHDHQPENYVCPFCAFAQGEPDKLNVPEDIVCRNEFAMAFISPRWWPGNEGHVLVVPLQHFENIYDISDEALSETYEMAKRVAAAVRSTYDCEGISMRQHNEPAGGQDVWHFHVHVFPRYVGDDLYKKDANIEFTSADVRLPYAKKLRAYLAGA